MNNEGITAYGWAAAAPESCGYIAPTILQIVRSLGVRRILDLGCGNGALCGELSRAGYEVAGAELDAGGVRLALLSVADQWRQHHTPLWHGGHIKFWSRDKSTQLLEEGHFRVTDFRGVGRFAYLWKSMVITARKTS